jgi:hypothetical protein
MGIWYSLYSSFGAKAKKPAHLLHAAGFKRSLVRVAALGYFPSHCRTMTLESIQHVSRHSGDTLEIFPALELSMLIPIFHDLPGIIFAEALNRHQILFSRSV